MPIDPTIAARGPEWQIGTLDAPAPADASGGGFGAALSSSIKSLTATQVEAAQASQALASGQASDPTAVVMAVERAQLAMQLAGQIRNKAVEAAQTIFQTQV
jgi:flagellar hook-basal body complex protein FliE